ncbi:MAG: hypothetical protein J0M26_18065 [Planctomycetes bacterium]|nr:hypothetical protein [Planctomycetota bacterium]
MSHTVEISTEVRDLQAVQAACRRLNLSQPTQGETKLFNRSVTGTRVQLPNWRYPVVFQLETGMVAFDNYEGRWGKKMELDRYLQAYAVEKVKLEARRKGQRVHEEALSDGSIKLTVQMGAGS